MPIFSASWTSAPGPTPNIARPRVMWSSCTMRSASMNGLWYGSETTPGAEADVAGALRRCGDEHLRAGNQLEPARVMLADPRLVVVEPVEVFEQLQVALDRQGRVLIVIVERRQKDAAAQIELVHAVSSGGSLSGRWSAIEIVPASEFPLIALLLLSWLPLPRGGGDMSELGADPTRGVPWPSNGLTEIPFRVYTDPEQYRLEQERIFKGPTWSFLCLAAEIANPGDYVATTIGETAVIVARDLDGQHQRLRQPLRASRQPALLRAQGNVNEIKCIYHGWTYDLAGKLTGVAFERGVNRQGGMPAEFRKDEQRPRRGCGWRARRPRLRPVSDATRRTSKPISDRKSSAHPPRMLNRPARILGRSTQVLPNNWKLYVENNKDTYHASHPACLPDDVPHQPADACLAASISTTAAAITSAMRSPTTQPRTPTTSARGSAPRQRSIASPIPR